MRLSVLFIYFTSFFAAIVNLPAEVNAPSEKEITGLVNQYQGGFLENRGQMHDEKGVVQKQVLFELRGKGMLVRVTTSGIRYYFIKVENEKKSDEHKNLKSTNDPKEITQNGEILNYEWCNMNMDLLGASIDGRNCMKEFPSDVDYNFYNTGDHLGLQGVKRYGKITIKNIYPGIDWVLTCNNSNKSGFKYDFIVHPGADPSVIRMKYNGPGSFKVKGDKISYKNKLGGIEEGELLCKSLEGDWVFKSSYKIISANKSAGEMIIQFNLSGYNKKDGILIDPPLQWATILGGDNLDGPKSITVDGSGNAYAVSYDYSTALPFTNPGGGAYYKTTGTAAATILKFNSSLALTWCTYFADYASINDIAANKSNGQIAITGNNSNSGGGGSALPYANPGGGAYYSTGATFGIYFAILNSDGTIYWCSDYASSSSNYALSVCYDPSGNLYVVGSGSSTFTNSDPGGGAYQQGSIGSTDAFIIKFNASLALQWATLLGGSDTSYEEFGFDVAADNSQVYLYGYTASADFPVMNAFRATYSGGGDLFVTCFNPNGVMQWSTYLGGSKYDYTQGDYSNSLSGNDMVIDGSGNLFVAGLTLSADFPIYNPGSGAYYQATVPVDTNYTVGGQKSGTAGFIVKFNKDGTLAWSTGIGSNNRTGITSLALDSKNNLYAIGETDATANYTQNAGGSNFFQGANSGGSGSYGSSLGTYFEDVYLMQFNALNYNPISATYLGGTDWTTIRGASVNSNDELFVIGESWSNTSTGNTLALMVDPGGGAYQQIAAKTDDAYILKFGAAAVSLPIELLNFYATPNGNKVDLAWNTESETNNDFFTVERADSSDKFQELLKVKGAGTTSKKNAYAEVDEKPLPGRSYYRLKQTDFDGKFTYSGIVPVTFLKPSKFDLNIFPNPSSGNNLSLNISGMKEDGSVLVVIRDILGKLYYSKVILSQGTETARFVLESSEALADGVYIITASENDLLVSRKIIISK